jgi:hypothetical protein
MVEIKIIGEIQIFFESVSIQIHELIKDNINNAI